ncbi:MAG: type II toxin-antitoxin system Phd/YefM family antitoxin [Neisseria sp.]|nr:type II toxin-antitoxin system Phd/YefM family antitoxin [Neisseria sp.]
MLHTIGSREFNQHPSRAQKQAAISPVFITTRGKMSHVLISYEEYRRLAGSPKNALEALQSLDAPDVSEIDLPIPPRSTAQRPPVDFGEE